MARLVLFGTDPRAVFLFQSRQAVQILSAIGFKLAAKQFANTAAVLTLAGVFHIWSNSRV